MKADVIHRFVDAETGAVHLPGSEVDMAPERVAKLERAKAVRRKAERAPAPMPPSDEVPERPKRRGRGRPRKGE